MLLEDKQNPQRLAGPAERPLGGGLPGRRIEAPWNREGFSHGRRSGVFA